MRFLLIVASIFHMFSEVLQNPHVNSKLLFAYIVT